MIANFIGISQTTTPLSRFLELFQKQTQAKHVFQMAIDMEYINVDCFSCYNPLIVPAKILLS